jgi:hypothetical protein
MNDNHDYLDAVSLRIAGAIVEFCMTNQDHDWHADDLRNYVTEKVGTVAPGSADRVLRDLRAKGRVQYRCVSRNKSLYRVLAVKVSQA